MSDEHRQQQLGDRRRAHGAWPGAPVRRSAPAVLGAVELVRVRHPRTGGRRRRRGHPGVPGLWWGSNGSHRLGDHQQRRLHARPVPRAGPSDRSAPVPRRRHLARLRAKHEVDHRTCAARRRCGMRSARRCAVRSSITSGANDRRSGEPPMSLRWVGQEHLDDVRAVIGHRPGARLDRVPRGAARLGGGRLQLRLRRSRRATSATSAPGACRFAVASCAATATPTSRPTRGRDMSRSMGCRAAVEPARLRRQRQRARRAG